MKEELKKRNITVSIIIPVYNVQEYLNRCLVSVLAQTLENYEVIIIDDGSTDDSGKICDKFAKENPDVIRVIHQKNAGTSATRRNALEIARGEYIGFVDSDDWIDRDMFKKLYEEAIRTGAEVTLCDLYKCGNGLLSIVKAYNGKKMLTPKNFLESYSPGYMVNKIYHRSLIKKLTNKHNGCQAEDSAVNIPLMCQIDKLAYVEEPLYYYYQRAISASNSDTFSKNNYIHDYLSALKYIVKSVENFDREKRNNVYNYILQCIQWGINNVTRKCYLANYAEFLQEILPIIRGYSCLKARPHYSQYIFMRTIPKNIIRFANSKLSSTQKVCAESIKFYTHDFNAVTIDLNELKKNKIPKIVQEAYKTKNINFVKEYLILKALYENGGIFIDDNVKLNLPLGELRANECFFGFRDNSSVNSKIFGATKEHTVIKMLLDTYEEDSYFNSLKINLERRIYFTLVGKLGVSENGGWTQNLVLDGKNIGKIYRCDKLSFKIQEKNVAELYYQINEQADKEGLTVISKEMMVYWDRTRDDFFKNVNNDSEKLKKKIKLLESKINDMYHSRSWKITAPLRKISSIFNRFKRRRKMK